MSDHNNSPQFLTIRDVAKAVGVTQRRAGYAIDAYAIEPATRAGIVRLWTPDQLDTIRSAVKRIESRREVPTGA